MRLSDHLLTQCGGESDIGDIFTNVARAVQKAERFELSDDVARASYNLTRQKPSTLLSALPLCRAPYRSMWLEWRGGITSELLKRENRRDPKIAPDPLKQGCLIETDASGQRGTMTFAWVHKENPERVSDPMYTRVNVSPLGTIFNWGGDAVADGLAALERRWSAAERASGSPGAACDVVLFMRHAKRLSDRDVEAYMKNMVWRAWKQYAHVASEQQALRQLERHATPFIAPHALGFFKWVAEMAMQSEEQFRTFMQKIVVESWEPDIEGEPPFVDTVIAMMNSRNAIEHRTVDLSGLNKQRAKRRRPLFLDYRTTHLRLSQSQTRAFRAGLMTREEAGRHTVRGHFKIRKTGIYWWSPFFRGDPTKPVRRDEYAVEG